jgi:hypothetical protein
MADAQKKETAFVAMINPNAFCPTDQNSGLAFMQLAFERRANGTV